MSRLVALATTTALALVAATPARADGTDYFHTATDSREVTVKDHGKRTSHQRLLIGGLAAGGVIAAGIGGYFNLDSSRAAHDVSADKPTGKTWGPTQIADVERAHRSGTRAVIGYSIGAAFLVGAVVVLWRTTPAEQTKVIRPGHVDPVIAPAPGGATLGAAWSF